jgi:large conductance mechanosensitive channel
LRLRRLSRRVAPKAVTNASISGTHKGMSDRDPLERIELLVRSGSRRLDLSGFRSFVLRGNVVDLAVGIVIGTAFTAVVKSLVNDFITPLVGIPLGHASDFSTRYWQIGGSRFLYGDFLNSLVSFVLIGLVVYYFVVRPVNHLLTRFKTATGTDIETKTCPECRSSIPYDATRCAFCTVVLPAATDGTPAGSEDPHPA